MAYVIISQGEKYGNIIWSRLCVFTGIKEKVMRRTPLESELLYVTVSENTEEQIREYIHRQKEK